MRPLPAAALCLLLAAAGPQVPISDLVLAPGVFAELPATAPVRFHHTRTGAKTPVDETLHLSRRPEGGLVIAGDTPIAEFGLGSANPIVLYFLEGVVREMAQETGGSPFYIRNRMREALSRTAIAGAVTEVQPFDKDPNRGQMGDWGGLTLEFTADRAVPGGVQALQAQLDAPEGYREAMVLVKGD
ncbi:hypothetical protein V8J36_02515 [Frigidibacter sp. MR17.14]|uniref:hypothetical protein n=1 Tax=Frigidibacter sp. MR17.14 TaxID=3126509 RepID=UPI003012A16F